MEKYENYPEDDIFYFRKPKKWYQKIINKIIYHTYNIDFWFYFHSPIYINIFFLPVLKEWWQARKVYKFPRIIFSCGKEEVLNRNTLNLFSFKCNRLGWKWKWDYISWESEPFVNITILNKFGITFRLVSPYIDDKGYPDCHLYWESMLEYLYMHHKDLIKTYENWGWIRYEDTEEKKYSVSYTTWNWNIIKPEIACEYVKKVKKYNVKVKENINTEKQETVG